MGGLCTAGRALASRPPPAPPAEPGPQPRVAATSATRHSEREHRHGPSPRAGPAPAGVAPGRGADRDPGAGEQRPRASGGLGWPARGTVSDMQQCGQGRPPSQPPGPASEPGVLVAAAAARLIPRNAGAPRGEPRGHLTLSRPRSSHCQGHRHRRHTKSLCSPRLWTQPRLAGGLRQWVPPRPDAWGSPRLAGSRPL